MSLPVQDHGENTEENDAENGAQNDENLAENDAIFHEEEEDVGGRHQEDPVSP
mgnify:CR=1 FL=1